MSSYVVCGVYASKKEADSVRAHLAKKGIPSYSLEDKPKGPLVLDDTAIRLYVRGKDHERALLLLKEIIHEGVVPPPPPKAVKTVLPKRIPHPIQPPPAPKLSNQKKPNEPSLARFIMRYIRIPFVALLFALFFLFLFLRLIHLTQVPIFNDEAIYLDWGWREITKPGMLFYSLYDAKQPVIMWLFGISQILFSDQLFAGRFVSVIFSVLSFWAIYAIGKRTLTKAQTALALFLYSIIPLFSFFDRQALMESGISCCILWSTYLFLRYEEKPTIVRATLLGVILGIGFLSKSSILIPTGLFFLGMILLLSKKNELEARVQGLVGCVVGWVLVSAILFLQPQFWDTLPTTSRYALTLNDLVSLPFTIWISNILVCLETFFVHITFGITVAAILGGFFGPKKIQRITMFIGLLLLSVILTGRSLNERYLVSYLALLVLPASWILARLFSFGFIGKVGVILFIVPAILLTVYQLFFINDYFRLLSNVPHAGLKEYYQGYTSGYGVKEAIAYLEPISKNEKIFIGVALATGNPENAIITYFHKNPNVYVGILDSQVFTNDLTQVDCFVSTMPIFFVSRGNYLAGLERFLSIRKIVTNPFAKNIIGIYHITTPCQGRAMPLEFN